MSIFSLKLKLQNSIQIFALALIYATAILFTSIMYGTDKWVLGFLPTIIVLSVIGEFALARAIVRLSSLSGSVEGEKDTKFQDRFAGINGLNGLLYALIPLVFCTMYLSLSALNINMFDFVIVHWGVSLSLLVVTGYFLHKTINQLSFTLLFISIIYGWTNIAKANKIKQHIEEATVPEGIDLSNSFKRLAKKYTKRIEWLENNITEQNKSEYNSKISIYQNVLRDFEDILNGIDT